VKFCSECGASVRRGTPEGDDHLRDICDACGTVHYKNPKIIAGCLPVWGDKLLLCRRAIEPRKGYWTLPAGYMEAKESTADGAAREAFEEACAQIEIDALLAVYSIPRISQVQVIYRARLVSPDVAAGPESEAVGLYRWDEIPWDDLAFPSVHWALRQFHAVRDQAIFAAHGNPPDEHGEY